MTVDNKASDPFYLTRFVFENSNMIRIVYYSSLDSPLVSIPFVLAMKQWKEKSHGAITYDFFEAVRKHLSSYCRVNVAEAMSQEEIVTYLAEYADKINA
ncbi:MAG: hypothetical protein BWZ03_00872 [bacterium ADurb.BinA186]|nr:MAG: hypothetical protein BWZ03_00872 [bacterium ADurb.BinA186]